MEADATPPRCTYSARETERERLQMVAEPLTKETEQSAKKCGRGKGRKKRAEGGRGDERTVSKRSKKGDGGDGAWCSGAGGRLEDIRQDIATFARERDWDQFHTVRNIVLALVGEVGELAECFQWKGEVKRGLDGFEEEEKVHVGEELADVLVYLVRLSDLCGIDLTTAVRQKMQKNRAKYPKDLCRGSSKKYTHYIQEKNEAEVKPRKLKKQEKSEAESREIQDSLRQAAVELAGAGKVSHHLKLYAEGKLDIGHLGGAELRALLRFFGDSRDYSCSKDTMVGWLTQAARKRKADVEAVEADTSTGAAGQNKQKKAGTLKSRIYHKGLYCDGAAVANILHPH